MTKKTETRYFTDHDILEALSIWAFVSVGWRVGNPDVARLVSVPDAFSADIKLRLALLTQPDDLRRVIEETDIDPHISSSLSEAWAYPA